MLCEILAGGGGGGGDGGYVAAVGERGCAEGVGGAGLEGELGAEAGETVDGGEGGGDWGGLAVGGEGHGSP